MFLFIRLMAPISILLASCLSFSNEGPGGSSGGFAFETSQYILDTAKEKVLQKLEVYDQNCFSQVLALKELPYTVDINRLRKLITEVRSEYFKYIPPRLDNHKKLHPIDFNFGWSENGTPYIEALHLYFLAYSASSRSDRNVIFVIERKLLIEASHIFGYLNQKEAQAFADKILQVHVYKTKTEREYEDWVDPTNTTVNSTNNYSCEELNRGPI